MIIQVSSPPPTLLATVRYISKSWINFKTYIKELSNVFTIDLDWDKYTEGYMNACRVAKERTQLPSRPKPIHYYVRNFILSFNYIYLLLFLFMFHVYYLILCFIDLIFHCSRRRADKRREIH